MLGCVASLATNFFQIGSTALSTKRFARDIAPEGKIITTPPFSNSFTARRLVSRLVFNASSVSSKSIGRILSITAGAWRRTRCVINL